MGLLDKAIRAKHLKSVADVLERVSADAKSVEELERLATKQETPTLLKELFAKVLVLIKGS